MTWSTTNKTWSVGEIVTAAMMNQYIRDQLNQTMLGVVTTAGDIVSAGSATSLSRLAKGSTATMLQVDASGTIGWGNVSTGMFSAAADPSPTLTQSVNVTFNKNVSTYQKFGRGIIQAEYHFVITSTGTSGQELVIGFSSAVAIGNVNAAGSVFPMIGSFYYLDQGVGYYTGQCFAKTSTSFNLVRYDGAIIGTGVAIGASTADVLVMNLIYPST